MFLQPPVASSTPAAVDASPTPTQVPPADSLDVLGDSGVSFYAIMSLLANPTPVEDIPALEVASEVIPDGIGTGVVPGKLIPDELTPQFDGMGTETVINPEFGSTVIGAPESQPLLRFSDQTPGTPPEVVENIEGNLQANADGDSQETMARAFQENEVPAVESAVAAQSTAAAQGPELFSGHVSPQATPPSPEVPLEEDSEVLETGEIVSQESAEQDLEADSPTSIVDSESGVSENNPKASERSSTESESGPLPRSVENIESTVTENIESVDGPDTTVSPATEAQASHETAPVVKSQPSPVVAKVIEQIVTETMSQMAVVRSAGKSDFSIRLDPPELGEVVVRMTRTDKGIRIRVHAVDPETHLLFENNAEHLTDSLNESGETMTLETQQFLDENTHRSFSEHVDDSSPSPATSVSSREEPEIRDAGEQHTFNFTA